MGRARVVPRGKAVAPSVESAGRVTITLAGARASYLGPGLDLAPHRNAATTVAIGLDVPFSLELFPNGTGSGPATASIALIPSGTRHHLRARGRMAFVYLDALSDDVHQLATADLVAAQLRIKTERAEVLRGWDAQDWCASLGVSSRIAGVDERIAGVVRRIDEAPQAFARLDDAARLAKLSPTRFQCLLRQAVGMPFRRYRLWRRMAVAMRIIALGETLTNAALDAGFSSSAHFSAAFRAMFGIAPSTLAGHAPRLVIDGRRLASGADAR